MEDSEAVTFLRPLATWGARNLLSLGTHSRSMEGKGLNDRVKDLLSYERFLISRRCGGTNSFDYVASRDDATLVLNVAIDIDSLAVESAADMRVASRVLRALAIIVGERAGGKSLNRGTVYFRYGVPALSPETFEDLLDGQPPLAYTGPGGEYVDIDGERLREARLQEGMSRGDLASEIGVTRSMIRRYEEDEGNPTVPVLNRIEEVLYVPLIRPVDVRPRFDRKLRVRKNLDMLEQYISAALTEIGLKVFHTYRAPFNAVSSADRHVVLTGVAEEESGISERASTIKDISKVLDSKSVFILREGEGERVEDIPLIPIDELDRLEEKEGFLELLEKRCA